MSNVSLIQGNRRPMVSVVTSFLNAAKFISEAIDSVLHQTYSKWEILLIDDGSEDASTNIAKKYAAKMPKQIRYLEHSRHENLGVAASRNVGVREAKGEYIALLDADDAWLPCKLERQIAIINCYPQAETIHGLSIYWRSWEGKSNHGDFVPRLPISSNTLVCPPMLLTRYHPLRKAFAPCVSSLLLRREVVLRIGGFEEQFRGVYQLYEDQAFLAKVYLHTHVFVADECWDKYRLHPGSCCGVWNMPRHYDSARLFFLNWFAEYLARNPMCDHRVYRALNRAFWQFRHPIAYGLLGPVARIARAAGVHFRENK